MEFYKETSQMYCSANRFSGFYLTSGMMLVFNNINALFIYHLGNRFEFNYF